jgi:hypothetical protein
MRASGFVSSAGKILVFEAVESLTEEAVLFEICDTIPHDWLYSKPASIQTAFGMGEDAKHLFCLDDWEDIPIEIFDQDPYPASSDYPDILTMAAALCSEDSSLQFIDNKPKKHFIDLTIEPAVHGLGNR